MIDLWIVTKLLLYTIALCIAAVVTYLTVVLVINPYRKRMYYSKYQDVSMTDKFYPLTGDFTVISRDYIEKGRYLGHYLRDFALMKNPPKMSLIQWAKHSQISVNDPELLTELDKRVPSFLDREPIDNSGFGRVGGTGGIGQIPSNESWKERRETFMKVIGINYASRYIPTFVKYLKFNLDKIKPGIIADVSQLANTISFEIILAIIFGNDIEEKLDHCNYEDNQGNVKRMKLFDCVMSITNDCNSAAAKVMNVLFPEFVDYDIGTQNARNTRNSNEVVRVLKKFINESEDQTSVYHTVTNKLGIDGRYTFQDSMSLLFGGHETTSKTLCSVLFFLKKYPNHLITLKKELKQVLLEDGELDTVNYSQLFDKNKLDNLEFLTMFLKETLRINPPAPRSSGYKSRKAFKLGSVTIPKNQIVVFNIYGSHYNTKQWKDPLAFEPSRFDPSSEYFLRPDGKNRHPLAYVPFTFGTRTCPGRALGKYLIAKVLLIVYRIDGTQSIGLIFCLKI